MRLARIEIQNISVEFHDDRVVVSVEKKVFTLPYNIKEYYYVTAHGHGITVELNGSSVRADMVVKGRDGVSYVHLEDYLSDKAAQKIHDAIGSGLHEAEVDIIDNHLVVICGGKEYKAPIVKVGRSGGGPYIYAENSHYEIRVGIDDQKVTVDGKTRRAQGDYRLSRWFELKARYSGHRRLLQKAKHLI